jgi:hypothetical protein
MEENKLKTNKTSLATLTNALVKNNHEARLPSKSLPFIVVDNLKAPHIDDSNRKFHSKLNKKNWENIIASAKNQDLTDNFINNSPRCSNEMFVGEKYGWIFFSIIISIFVIFSIIICFCVYYFIPQFRF